MRAPLLLLGLAASHAASPGFTPSDTLRDGLPGALQQLIVIGAAVLVALLHALLLVDARTICSTYAVGVGSAGAAHGCGWRALRARERGARTEDGVAHEEGLVGGVAAVDQLAAIAAENTCDIGTARASKSCRRQAGRARRTTGADTGRRDRLPDSRGGNVGRRRGRATEALRAEGRRESLG